MSIKVGQFTLSNAEKTGTAVCTFLLEPGIDSEKELGKLCFLLQIKFDNLPLREDLDWAKGFYSDLKDFVEEEYYQSLKNVLKIDKDFENLLKKLNQWLQRKLLEERKIDLLIAAIDNNTVYFANLGNSVVHLLQGEQITELPLPEQKGEEKFTDIVSGSLEDEDVLIFSTENLLDYFSREKIKQIAKNHTVTESIKKVEELTSNLADQISLGIIFLKKEIAERESKSMIKKTMIKKETEDLAPEKIDETAAKKEPIEEAKIEESETKKIQRPIEPKKTKEKYIANIKKSSRLAVDKIKDEFSKLTVHAETILQRPKSSKWLALKKIVECLILFLKRIACFLKIDVFLKKFSNRFNQYSYFQKTIIIFSLILAIIFVYSLADLGRQEYQKQSEKKYRLFLEELQKKQNELSAALIYNDENKAKLLAIEIDSLLKRFPRQNQEQEQNYNYFRSELQKSMGKIYRQEYITDLKLTADLTEIDPNIKISGLIKMGNHLYTYNPTNNFIYQINIIDGSLSQANQESINTGHLEKATLLDKDSILFSHSNQGLAILNTLTKKLVPAELSVKHQNLEIKDIAIYLKRLYLLDPTNNQIFKYTRTLSGYGDEQPWIKEENIDLKNARSLAVDGSIYVAGPNQVLKFYQGIKQEFKIDDIYPPLSNLVKIETWLDSKYIYLLEPENKRLIIFDKNGKLVKQIISDYFNDLIDFAVNEKEDKLWLLNGTKIIEINLK